MDEDLKRGDLVLHPFAQHVGVVVAVADGQAWTQFVGIEPGVQIGPVERFTTPSHGELRDWLSRVLLSKAAKDLSR